MNATGGFPVDLILFGMIAAFLVLRLRSVLGKRTGFEGAPPQPGIPPAAGTRAPVIDGRAEVSPATAPHRLPDPQSPAGQALRAMHEIDRRFDTSAFLTGAQAAFRMIVTAFAAGDRTRLRPLLSDATYQSFDQAIAAREAAGQTQRTEIREIIDAQVQAASLEGSRASIVVRFETRQVNLTLGKDGQPVTGTDAVTELADVWTFTRDLRQPDVAWHLAAAHSA